MQWRSFKHCRFPVVLVVSHCPASTLWTSARADVQVLFAQRLQASGRRKRCHVLHSAEELRPRMERLHEFHIAANHREDPADHRRWPRQGPHLPTATASTTDRRGRFGRAITRTTSSWIWTIARRWQPTSRARTSHCRISSVPRCCSEPPTPTPPTSLRYDTTSPIPANPTTASASQQRSGQH